MPLPTDTAAPWPPPDVRAVHQDQQEWAAWYAGDPARLAANAGLATTQAARTAEHSFDPQGGRRRFWQRRYQDSPASSRRALHIPLAADIAAVAADLLFGEPPDLTVPDDAADETTVAAANDRWAVIADTTGFDLRLVEAAETCAALGGVYLRAGWDLAVSDTPIASTVEADRAVPDFAYGILRAVTFWEDVHVEGSVIWRHLERHEPGVILHGLYIGTAATLGRSVPLTSHPATAALAEAVPVPSEIGRLSALYVPNALPNRRRRGYQGRADIAGCEDPLDALDETWTSWMRDVRLGQARVFAARELLDPTPGQRGRGAGRSLDLDQEIFTPVAANDLEAGLSKLLLPYQAAIRFEEHSATALALVERIVSTAGYSPQTFGLHIDGQAESGSALRVREGRTWRTQGRKQRYWGPNVTEWARLLLAIDRVVFGRPTPALAPALRWPDTDADDPAGRAQTISLLRQAEAISDETAVQMAQPHLDEAAVADEVARIKAERGAAVPDPLTFHPQPPVEDEGTAA